MVFVRLDRELGRVGANLGQRSEPGVPVEPTILDPLSHYHAGGLLESHGHRIRGVGQHRLQCVDDGGQLRAVPFRGFRGVANVFSAERQVAAVDGEAGEQFGQRVAEQLRLRG